MNKGTVEQLDIPEKIYGFPKNRFVADFIGQCNLLDGTIVEVGVDRMKVEIAGVGIAETCRRRAPKWAPRHPGATPGKIKISASLPADVADEVHFRGTVHDCLYLATSPSTSLNWKTAWWRRCCPTPRPGQAKFFNDNDAVEIAWRFDAGHFLTE